MQEFFRVGNFASTHGVKGEFKVFPTTDEPERFKKYKEIILDNGKTRRTAKIESVKFFKNMVILKIEGVDDMDAAQLLKGTEFYVPRQKAVPLSKDEYYIADLVGIKVYSDEAIIENLNSKNDIGYDLGTLSDVIQTGANDVYDVAMIDGRNVLLPAIKECILKVNINEGYMLVHVMDGLL